MASVRPPSLLSPTRPRSLVTTLLLVLGSAIMGAIIKTVLDGLLAYFELPAMVSNTLLVYAVFFALLVGMAIVAVGIVLWALSQLRW